MVPPNISEVFVIGKKKWRGVSKSIMWVIYLNEENYGTRNCFLTH